MRARPSTTNAAHCQARQREGLVIHGMRVMQVFLRYWRRSRSNLRSTVILTCRTPLSDSRHSIKDHLCNESRPLAIPTSHNLRMRSHSLPYRHLTHTTTTTARIRTRSRTTHKAMATLITVAATWQRQAVRRHTLVCPNRHQNHPCIKTIEG